MLTGGGLDGDGDGVVGLFREVSSLTVAESRSSIPRALQSARNLPEFNASSFFR
jgi:hypothetical protein